jgi:hypothetical protein
MEHSFDDKVSDRTNVVRNNLVSACRTRVFGPSDTLISWTKMTVRDRRAGRGNWRLYARTCLLRNTSGCPPVRTKSLLIHGPQLV